MVAGAALSALYIAASYRIAAGMSSAERMELEDSPADYGADFESVRFWSRRRDVMLDGWYMPGRVGMPMVVYVHGISATRSSCGMTAIASDLNRRGFGALLFDLRGCGLSGGDRISGGWHERLDVLGACDYLRSRGVEPGKIGLLGLSMGAAAVALAATSHAGIRAVVLDSPYARASDLLSRETVRRMRLPVWLAAALRPGAELMARLVFDIEVSALVPEKAVRRLDYPILVIHGGADDRIPPDHGRRVHRAAPADSALWLVDDTGHNEASTEHKSEYSEMVAAYFLERLI